MPSATKKSTDGNAPAFGFYLNAGFVPHSETWIRSEHTAPTLDELPEHIADRAAEVGFEFETMPGPDDTWISSEEMASLTLRDDAQGPEPDAAALDKVFQALEAAGRWTIQVTIPAFPDSEAWREVLGSLEFRPAMERLTRPVSRTD